jgi:hypothetical protein
MKQVIAIVGGLFLLAVSSVLAFADEDITNRVQEMRDFKPPEPSSPPSSIDLGRDVSIGVGTGATPDARGDSGFGAHVTITTK